MAIHFEADDKGAVLKAYAANHPEWGAAHAEYQWWKNARSLTLIPWGVDRATAITAAATAFSVSLTETSPWTREQQFWAGYTPTPAA